MTPFIAQGTTLGEHQELTSFIAPGATLGVMGGGQLARMFVHAAQQMGYATAVLDADANSPAGCVSHHHIQADYLDDAGLAQLAACCAAVTTEFENVPAAALKRLAATRPVAPSAEAVEVCQDRAAEKAHFARCGVACAPHALIAEASQLADVSDHLLPGILKTTRMGYDGKGQARVNNPAELSAAWHAMQRAGAVTSCVVEKLLPLKYEVSVIVARGANGSVVHLPVQQNLHVDGILAVTQVPAPNLTAEVQTHAIAAAEKLAASLNYVGVLCVEFFVLQDGSLVANEMAPRPHNSGHYSIDACDVSQFDLQVRALAAAPLVAPRLHSAAVMLNLLGGLWFARGASAVEPAWEKVLGLPGAHLHLYGKTQARAGRKMGHLTFTAATPALARCAALQACDVLGLPSF
ncbi:MAG: 5-(carboxyamino)imidazole ribonucleotide synthase [Pseudorhodobacter sp.]|nr:5-(carboxyamino)imidazole ribonucleotide synthase [Rhizobacter sp.]